MTIPRSHAPRGNEKLADRGTPYPACGDLPLVALAMSSDYPADQVFIPEPEPWPLPDGAYKRGGGPT